MFLFSNSGWEWLYQQARVGIRYAEFRTENEQA